VHKQLGNGFQKEIYQHCLCLELGKAGLAFVQEQEIPIIYNGIKIGVGKIDVFVEDKIMVKVQALSKLGDTEFAEAKNCLEAYNLEIGLLINFGRKKLTFNRIINPSLQGETHAE
jgi:GxxExxY protein